MKLNRAQTEAIVDEIKDRIQTKYNNDYNAWKKKNVPTAVKKFMNSLVVKDSLYLLSLSGVEAIILSPKFMGGSYSKRFSKREEIQKEFENNFISTKYKQKRFVNDLGKIESFVTMESIKNDDVQSIIEKAVKKFA